MSSKRATITDVAKAAGVSIGAVSRILNGDPSITVREQTRSAVHKAMAELGYSPNPHARSLRLSRTDSLAMILPEIDSPAFAPMIQGAQRAAHGRGYAMLLGGVGPDCDDPELPSRLLRKNQVDGFLVSSGLREAETLAALRALPAPTVLLNRYLDRHQPHVVCDDEGGAAASVRYLTSLGHRRIAFLGSSLRFLGTRRLAGYRAGLAEAGITFDPGLVRDAGYDRAGGEREAELLLASTSPPTAVFATNHLVAAGAMAAAARRGIVVPSQLSIASFYDSPVAELLHPSLTAVRFPLEELGFQAASMLIDLIEGKRVRKTAVVLSHGGIVERGSTAPVPVAAAESAVSAPRGRHGHRRG